MYHDKLKLFFAEKKISQKQVAEKLGYTADMISRYFKGKAKFDSDFVYALVCNYPDIDLKSIFSDEETKSDKHLCEPVEKYLLSEKDIDVELQEIEKKIGQIRASLARKRPEK